MSEPDYDWEPDEDGPYDQSWMVERWGDSVFLSFSNADGTARVLEFNPEDALDIGTALAQAGFTPEFEENKSD